MNPQLTILFDSSDSEFFSDSLKKDFGIINIITTEYMIDNTEEIILQFKSEEYKQKYMNTFDIEEFDL